MYTIIIIIILSFLIMRHLYFYIKNNLEGFCSSEGNSKSVCESITNSKNTAGIAHINELIKETKKDIESLLGKVSKSLDESKVEIQNNSKGIQTNIKNTDKMKDALS